MKSLRKHIYSIFVKQGKKETNKSWKKVIRCEKVHKEEDEM